MTRLPAPQDVQAAFATVLVDEWLRAGVTDAVTCPGSRSTPLLVALAEAAERGALRLHVLLDERSAGFFALGLGLAQGVPAPVVTTSGTAAAELHPAVLEAHHSAVPMLAVTADRPPELHDFGAPQTVRQVGLFGDAVRWEADPGPPDVAAAWSWRSTASRSVLEACGGPGPGPVHLNLAFREPLLGRAEAVLARRPESGGEGDHLLGQALATGTPLRGEQALVLLRRGRPEQAPWHRRPAPVLAAPPAELVELLARAGERGLIIAGGGVTEADRGPIWQLSRAAGWPVLASPQSGCRVPGAIGSADALLRTALVRGWRPDVVLRLGAPWASRVVNEWLANLDCLQVLVDPWGSWAAADRPAGEAVATSPSALCREVASGIPVAQTARAQTGGTEIAGGPSAGAPGLWGRQWATAERLAQAAIDGALDGEQCLVEPAIARALLDAVAEDVTVVASSSMPVRDLEWWGRPRIGTRVLANRGVNGIDGVLSTAVGVAASGCAPRVVALLGDLAFLYDIGALLAAIRGGTDLDVVVIDNDGGGIFNFLPQATGQPLERFERLWGTPHGADLVAIARSFGAPAERVGEAGGLAGALAEDGQGKGLRVFVAKTDRVADVAVHRRLHAAIEAALSGATW